MINHVIFRSSLRHGAYPIRSTMTVQFNVKWTQSKVFYEDHTCMIGYNVVLYAFHGRPHPIRSIMIVQILFRCRLHLYDQSYRCFVWSSTQTIPYPISHGSSIMILAQTAPIQSVMSQSYIIFVIDLTCTIIHIIFLSYFHDNRILSDRS